MKIPRILEQNREEIVKIFEEIKTKLNNHYILVIEGKKDKKKLQMIGINRNIVEIGQKSLVNFIEILPEVNGFIILTDFDRKGETMAKRLNELLRVKNVEINLDYRNKLKLYFKKFCKDIESVISLYLKLKLEG
ncbi:MAG: hypothetical protein EAX96_16380 [Candidatus Lokiarchaeota archaeon]|nr:hypothetical protein [Candidatus Lokiarchaeota archaeon]